MLEHLFGTSLQGHLLFYALLAYLFLLAWKHALGSHGDLRAIGFVAGVFLLPALFIAGLTQGSDLFGVSACYDDAARWWNFSLKAAEGEPPRALNLISGTLLLASLYVAVTAAAGLFARFYSWRSGGHVHALHKVLITWAVVLLGLLVYLKSNDVNLTPLLLGMGALSIVIGLALQDPLANFFAGIALDMDGTIRREEWIKVSSDGGDTIGKVVEKGWRATHLLTPDHELVILPNRDIAGKKILNYHRPETRHVHTLTIGTVYAAPPIQVKEVLRIVMRREPTIAKDPPPEVHVINYGESSIDYQLRFWVDDYGDSRHIKDLVLTRVWYALHYNNINFAYPTRVLHHQSPARLADERQQRDDDVTRLAAFLTTIPLLANNLLRQDFEFMALNSFRRGYAAGEHVLIKGTAGDALYIIEEGTCVVTLPVGVKQLDPGDFFGEMSLLKGGDRSADVVAGPAGCTLARVDRACMETLFRNYPALLQELTRTRDVRHQESTAGQVAATETAPDLGARFLRALRRYLLPW